MKPDANPLPYVDNKPIGAADFYFAINATFRFILARTGIEGLRRYWTDMGTGYFAPVSNRWKAKGLAGIEEYWRAFFKAEPNSEVEVRQIAETVIVDVKTCPAIQHLRSGNREIVPCFCQHCYFISEAIAAPAGFTVRIQGGNGSCTQTFQPSSSNVAPQNLAEIKVASC